MAETLEGQMDLIFDHTSLNQSAMGTITGTVFFEFWTYQFPTSGWNDFVVVLANWWLDAVVEMERGFVPSVRFQMMDGPYWIVAVDTGEQSVRLECMEDRRQPAVVHEEIVSVAILGHVVRRFARQVLSACLRRGFRSLDLDELGQRIAVEGEQDLQS